VAALRVLVHRRCDAGVLRNNAEGQHIVHGVFVIVLSLGRNVGGVLRQVEAAGRPKRSEESWRLVGDPIKLRNWPVLGSIQRPFGNNSLRTDDNRLPRSAFYRPHIRPHSTDSLMFRIITLRFFRVPAVPRKSLIVKAGSGWRECRPVMVLRLR
jgi:hypothetical protein